jgi:hypothetical protein
VQIPAGFAPIFNGRNLDGWHLSRTTHHGTVGNFYVENGAMLASQRPFGQGGLLLTDKVYKDFELYLELKPDAGFKPASTAASSCARPRAARPTRSRSLRPVTPRET